MKTLIAVPSHDYVHADFARCLMELDKPANTGFAMITNTLIYNARNLIAKGAIENGFDRVLWLDADMKFKDDTLIRLSEDMDEGRDFVTGLYFTRKEPIKPCLHNELHWKVKDDGWIDTGATCYWNYPQNAVFEIACCGFGCVMTSVPLLKRMCEKYGTPFYPLMGMGEDTTFCFRATQNGEKLYCDSRIKCGHIGQVEINESTYFESQKWRPDK